MNEHKSLTIDISSRAIFKVLFIVLGLFFVNQVKDVLLIVFISLVLAAAIDPTVTTMERRGIPRGFGIAILYVILIGFVSLLTVLFVPLVVDQLRQLASSLPSLYEKGLGYIHTFQNPTILNGVSKGLQTITDSLGGLTQGLFTHIFSFFGGVFSFFGILVITFYLTLEERGMKRIAVGLSPAKYRPYLTQLFHRIEDRLGKWLRGQLLLGLIIFGMSWIGLSLLHVNYALVLAIIAGMTEMVPAVGPFIGAVPAVIVGMSQYPLLGFWILLLYTGIQQFENHLIVPKVMSQSTGLNPVVIIVSLLVGAKVAGIVGVVLAIPTAIIVSTFFEDFVQERHAEETRLEPMPKQSQ